MAEVEESKEDCINQPGFPKKPSALLSTEKTCKGRPGGSDQLAGRVHCPLRE